MDCCFDGKVAEENLTEESKILFDMPNPLPIIVHKSDGVWLIDGGNGKIGRTLWISWAKFMNTSWRKYR